MTFNTIYLDGRSPMYIAFADAPAFWRWEHTISNIKQEAARIVFENPEPDNQSEENIQAICAWVKCVDALVESGVPVLPSILAARLTFIEVAAGN
jgi:hypothetical protein